MDEPVQITLRMTERDFAGLTETTMEWGSHWEAHRGRFERADVPVGPFDPNYHPADHWQMIYWVEPRSYPALMLARAFLDARGIAYEVAFDTIETGATHVILTDYKTAVWRDGEVEG